MSWRALLISPIVSLLLSCHTARTLQGTRIDTVYLTRTIERTTVTERIKGDTATLQLTADTIEHAPAGTLFEATKGRARVSATVGTKDGRKVVTLTGGADSVETVTHYEKTTESSKAAANKQQAAEHTGKSCMQLYIAGVVTGLLCAAVLWLALLIARKQF